LLVAGYIKKVDNKIELSDGSVLLRPYRTSDIDNLYEAVRESIPELKPWMEWCHDGYCVEESQSFIKAQQRMWKKGVSYNFAITDSNDGNYLGGCGLNRIDLHYGMANLGYWVRTSHTRRGVATSVTRLLAKFGFEELGLKRIEILTDVNNTVSQRVAEKAGATREGSLRNRITIHDKVFDAVMFSLIPGDLE
jgi:ribosomal-protein-serine acetyltransferase